MYMSFSGKVKCCKIICVSIAVLGVYTLGISLLLWWLYSLMANYCCKKDSTESMYAHTYIHVLSTVITSVHVCTFIVNSYTCKQLHFCLNLTYVHMCLHINVTYFVYEVNMYYSYVADSPVPLSSPKVMPTEK